MAGTLGDGSACTIRGLIWALGRLSYVKDKPEALKTKGKKYFLELKLISAYEQLEKILNFIDVFEKTNVDYSSNDETSWKNGAYMRIFVNGIQEVIRSFSPDLMDLEKSLLLDPTGMSVEALATAQHMYDTYVTINSIIQQVCDRNMCGCQILDLCHKCALRCQMTVVLKLNILVGCLHRQMLKQIKSWILYGELHDPFREFFIRQSPVNSEVTSPRSLPNQPSFDASISSEFCVSLIESTTALLPFDKNAQQNLADYIDKCYDIDATQLPAHLPYSLVAKMLTLGKFMIQIKNNPSNKIPVSFMTVNLCDYGIDQSEVRSMLKQLEDSSAFHHHMLDNLVDFIWCHMNRYMRRVAEEQGDLSAHHRNITDVYLMGRGELFRHFLDKACHVLLSDATKVFSRNLDLSLDRVAQVLYGTDDVNFLKRFHFSLPPKGDTPAGRSVLSVMKLVYKSPWPLPLIYSQEALDTYNTIFIFLLNLKRSHRALTLAWNDMEDISHENYKRSANELHFRLISLVTNLESYVFVDVIQSEMDSFWEVVQQSDSFDEIQRTHAKFLSNIIMRLFLPSDNQLAYEPVADCQSVCSEINKNVGMVHKEIMNLFSITHEFLMSVKILTLSSPSSFNKMNDLNSKFDSLVVSLISLVKKINEKYCSEYLRILIMRLDYNDYYLTHCGM